MEKVRHCRFAHRSGVAVIRMCRSFVQCGVRWQCKANIAAKTEEALAFADKPPLVAGPISADGRLYGCCLLRELLCRLFVTCVRRRSHRMMMEF